MQLDLFGKTEKKEWRYTEETCPVRDFHWEKPIEYTYPENKPYKKCKMCGWWRPVKI